MAYPHPVVFCRVMPILASCFLTLGVKRWEGADGTGLALDWYGMDVHEMESSWIEERLESG